MRQMLWKQWWRPDRRRLNVLMAKRLGYTTKKLRKCVCVAITDSDKAISARIAVSQTKLTAKAGWQGENKNVPQKKRN